MRKLIFLQLNELNFNYVQAYAELGHLPNFTRLFVEHGYQRTISESEHRLANPWIQWPTVHTGLDYAEHGIFRLGDIVELDRSDIYQTLEENGVSVAAISPFNASNRTRNSAFFVPDPWTPTRFDGSRDLKYIYEALVAVTRDYARGHIGPVAGMKLAAGAAANLNPSALPTYLKAVSAYIAGQKWWRAVICDQLLTDVFVRHWQLSQPDFSTLFLNGGAHLQHHYLFSSAAYQGERKNPDWHVAAGEDPLLDILKVYDTAIGRFMRLAEGNRLIIATGLHQEPHERPTFYYRLTDPASFLKEIGVGFDELLPLMTEDFVLKYPDAAAAARAERKLLSARSIDVPDIFYLETGDSPVRTLRTAPEIFHVENRGDSLYVQLKPTSELLHPDTRVCCGNMVVENFADLVALAQVKNTHHEGTGYYTDTDFLKGELPESFPLRNIFDIILHHFAIAPPGQDARKLPAWLTRQPSTRHEMA
jgi:hypothetical protein